MRSRQFLIRNLQLLTLIVALCGGSALASDFFDFIAPRTFPSGGYPTALAVADFNRDGNLDAAVTTYGDNPTVAVLLGNGDGTFGPPATYPIGRNASAIVAGDFNNDGYPDLAVVDYDGIQILLNNGNGTFQAGSTISGVFSANLVAADFNGDGNLDFAVPDGNAVTVLLGNGDGTFQSGVSSPAGSYVAMIAVGDFNGDGKPDLAVVDYYDGQYHNGTNELTIVIGKGDGTFLPPVSYPTPGRPYWLVVADFNHDGKADVAISRQGSNPDSTKAIVEVFFGNGDGTMGNGKSYPIGNNFYSPESELVTGNFNAPGNLDLLVFGGDRLTVLGVDKKGDLHKQSVYAVGSGCYGCFAAGNFAGNGRQQLVLALGGWRGVAILATTNGNLNAPVVYATGPGVSGNGAGQLAEGDFNGDGNLDLFATHSPVKLAPLDLEVTVSPGNGDGTLGSPIVTKIPVNGVRQSTPFAAVGDFNGDGRLDAAITLTAPQGPYNDEILILLGSGDGRFQPGASYSHTAGFGPMQVADFNHDGNPDIASACGDGVCVLLGKGHGEFEEPVVYAIDNHATLALAVGDFNNDGNPDIAVIGSCFVGNGCQSVSILFGNGDGTFGTPTTYQDYDSPVAIAVGDFNGDGNLDLAIVDNIYGDTSGAHLLLGDGKGNFRRTRQLAVGEDATTLAVGDFNGDGKLDLAVGDTGYAGPGELSVLHGNGDGTFQVRTPYAVPAPNPMVAGNFYKHRDPDLAGLTQGGVTIYLNSHSR
jgi:hypothetical protein